MFHFLKSLENIEFKFPSRSRVRFRIISNSANIPSSETNLKIASKFHGSVIPFVGIHPGVVMDSASPTITVKNLEYSCNQLVKLLQRASGIGEIGLDPKYGHEEIQLQILEKQLQLSESRPSIPISIHTRNTVEKVSEILSTFRLSKRVLFHWFAGTESELERIQSRGFFASFGPALIFSKRLQNLLRSANQKLVLAETDSPIIFSSISKTQPLSPFAVSSVIFKMAEIRQSTYEDMLCLMEENANDFLQAQNSLRVRTE
jgi:TatD family hydrolase